MALMGRPTKMTSEAMRAIVRAIRRGANKTEAARAGGVALSTLMQWQRYGRDGWPQFESFVRRMNRARAAFEAQRHADWEARQAPFNEAFEAILERNAARLAAILADRPDELGPPSLHELEPTSLREFAQRAGGLREPDIA